MHIETLATDDPRWAAFVAEHPDSTVFHLSAWSDVLRACYGFPTFGLAVMDGAEVAAGLPVAAVRRPFSGPRWVSLPFSDACSPLVREDTPAEEVASTLVGHAANAGVADLEIRASLPQTPGCHPLSAGFRHVVALPSAAEQLHPKKNHRNARNRADRAGITVTVGRTSDDVRRYYDLHVMTRRRLGVPVQPRRFFDLIYERLIARELGFVAHAALDDRTLASGLYLTHGSSMVAKFGASDPASRDSGAGYLLEWEVMRRACEQGFETLDFGRTDPDAEGLRLYKAGWGATESPLVYTHVAATAPAGGPGVPDFTRGIIRRSPAWVCRAAGELLYRWTA